MYWMEKRDTADLDKDDNLTVHQQQHGILREDVFRKRMTEGMKVLGISSNPTSENVALFVLN